MQATSGLGKAAAYALSNEGFYVVLGAHSIVILLLLFVSLFIQMDIGCLIALFFMSVLSLWDLIIYANCDGHRESGCSFFCVV